MNLIDSHAHLACFKETIDEILASAKSVGIEAIINIATCKSDLQFGLDLSQRYPWVYNTAAITPHDVENQGSEDFSFFKSHVNDLVAIGETGLDYYYEHSPKQLQQTWFIRYLEFALESNLPIVIHCREAFEDLTVILKEHFASKEAPRGVLHCFTGTQSEAKKVLDLGLMISFSGIVTFKKSIELQQIAKYVPLESIVVETDAPYLAPQSKRGKTNQPAFITETATKIAAIKGLNEKEAFETLVYNTKKLFTLS